MAEPSRRVTPLVVIRSFVFAVAFYATTAVFLLLGSWLLIMPRRVAMKGLVLHGASCTLLLRWICGTRLDVRGRHHLPVGACLVIAKHQSAFETFALIPELHDPAVVLKDELKWIPFYGWFCLKFGHILIRRDRGAAALKGLIQKSRARVADGRHIVIFPEGTRTTPGAPGNYKPGYVAIYEGAGVPAVPLALNSGCFWPRRSFWRFPGTIVFEFLPPLPPGLPRGAFRTQIESSIEMASARLVAEACPDQERLEQINLNRSRT